MRNTQTLIAVFSVALGVAAFTTVSAINAWQHQKIRDLAEHFAPDVLVVRLALGPTRPVELDRNTNYGITFEEAMDLRGVPGVISVAYRGNGSAILGSNVRITRFPVSEEIFEVLGLGLSAGRALTEEDRLFDLPIAVIGATIANELFGGAQQAVGQILDLGNRQVVRVEGVMEPIPDGIVEMSQLDIAALVPHSAAFARPVNPNNPRPSVTYAYVKHEPGAGPRAAEGVRAALDALPIGPAYEVVSSETWLDSQYVFRSEVADELSRGSSWIVLLALVATLGNLANVLGLRAASRARTVAVHRALGANNLQVAGKILLDGLAIGGSGTVLGVALWPLADRLARIGGESPPVTPQAFLHAAAAGLAITLLAVAAPTIWTLRLPIGQALRKELNPPTWEGIALTGMAAGVLALVVASAIEAGTGAWFQRRLNEIGGDRVVVSNRQLPGSVRSVYATPPIDEADAVAIAALPGVVQVVRSITHNTTLVTDGPNGVVTEPIAGARVDPEFFQMFPKPILHGRVPTRQDETIIGTYVAGIAFPHLALPEIVGETIRLGRPTGIMQTSDIQDITVVGVYASQPVTSMGDITDATIVRLAQPDGTSMAGALVADLHIRIDSAADYQAVLSEIRDLIDARYGGAYAPATVHQPAGDLRAVRATIMEISEAWKTIAWIALVVGGAGLASVVIIRLVRDRPELAVRRALGATQVRIATESTGTAVRVASYAAAVGLVLAGGVSYWVSTLAPWEFFWPWQEALVAVVTALTIALAAVIVPVWTLSGTPPWSVLKEK